MAQHVIKPLEYYFNVFPKYFSLSITTVADNSGAKFFRMHEHKWAELRNSLEIT